MEMTVVDDGKSQVFVPDMQTVSDAKDDPSKKTNRVSRRKVRVENQMQAFELGAAENRSLLGQRGSNKKQKKTEVTDGRSQLLQMIKRDLEEPIKEKGLGRGRTLPSSKPSTFSTRIPGIRQGQVTLLNTEASDIRFYSFFARTHPQVRGHWESFVEAAVDEELEVRGESRVWKAWSTVVEIVLDKQGQYVNTFLHRTSGLKPLDIAAIDGLEATSFLNPPEELIDEDGYVRLFYHLTVEGPATLAERRPY